MGSLLQDRKNMRRDEGGHGFTPTRRTARIFVEVGLDAETVHSKPSIIQDLGEKVVQFMALISSDVLLTAKKCVAKLCLH